MKIETKRHRSKGVVEEGVIVSITSRIYRKGIIADYTVDIRECFQVDELESNLFPTKEELLNSL